MNSELIHTLTSTFEAHAQQTDGGTDYWLARDIQHLLGYDEWRNFNTAISRAKTACEVSGHLVPDHFVGVNKMVDLGSGSQREIEDLMLTFVQLRRLMDTNRDLAEGWVGRASSLPFLASCRKSTTNRRSRTFSGDGALFPDGDNAASPGCFQVRGRMPRTAGRRPALPF